MLFLCYNYQIILTRPLFCDRMGAFISDINLFVSSYMFILLFTQRLFQDWNVRVLSKLNNAQTKEVFHFVSSRQTFEFLKSLKMRTNSRCNNSFANIITNCYSLGLLNYFPMFHDTYHWLSWISCDLVWICLLCFCISTHYWITQLCANPTRFEWHPLHSSAASL